MPLRKQEDVNGMKASTSTLKCNRWVERNCLNIAFFLRGKQALLSEIFAQPLRVHFARCFYAKSFCWLKLNWSNNILWYPYQQIRLFEFRWNYVKVLNELNVEYHKSWNNFPDISIAFISPLSELDITEKGFKIYANGHALIQGF